MHPAEDLQKEENTVLRTPFVRDRPRGGGGEGGVIVGSDENRLKEGWRGSRSGRRVRERNGNTYGDGR